jgi:hypothetical protein
VVLFHDTGEMNAKKTTDIPSAVTKQLNFKANNQQLKIHLYPKVLTRLQFETGH